MEKYTKDNAETQKKTNRVSVLYAEITNNIQQRLKGLKKTIKTHTYTKK